MDLEVFPSIFRETQWCHAELSQHASGASCHVRPPHGRRRDGSRAATPKDLAHRGHPRKFNQQPIGSMYAIYGNIYDQYTPNVSIYTSTMDPSWATMGALLSRKAKNLRRHAIEILSPRIETDPYENLEATEPCIQTSESCTVHDTTRNGVL